MFDTEDCDLVITKGETGPSSRDLTPDGTRMVITRELEGFGELMRRVSLEQVPTAILSRQIAATRGHCLIVNLPRRPPAIDVCLNTIFPAIPRARLKRRPGRDYRDSGRRHPDGWRTARNLGLIGLSRYDDA
jgi:molybdopterin biosynthesis enzyme MoaB